MSVGDTKRLAEYLVESGRLSQEQVDEVLSIQSRPGERRRLGEIIVSRGFASAAAVKIALAKQRGTG